MKEICRWYGMLGVLFGMGWLVLGVAPVEAKGKAVKRCQRWVGKRYRRCFRQTQTQVRACRKACRARRRKVGACVRRCHQAQRRGKSRCRRQHRALRRECRKQPARLLKEQRERRRCRRQSIAVYHRCMGRVYANKQRCRQLCAADCPVHHPCRVRCRKTFALHKSMCWSTYRTMLGRCETPSHRK